ncbi:MAG: N-acetylmuramoyl-L-alanine amidase [Ignavibacteria bacterium]
MIKKIFLFFFLLMFFFLPASFHNQQQINLSIVFPKDDTRLQISGKPVYLIGLITPADAELKINNSKAVVDNDGAFIDYTDVILFKENDTTKGKFIFEITTAENSRRIEKVYNVIPKAETSRSDTLEVDKSWPIKPSADRIMQPGEYIDVEIKASPEADAFFTIEGSREKYPLTENKIIDTYYWADAIFGEGFKGINDTISGIYRGSFKLNSGLKDVKLKITLEKKPYKKITVVPNGKISAMENTVPKIVEIKKDKNPVIGRYGPEKGYNLQLSAGIKLEVAGKEGNWYKVKLSNDEYAFVPDSLALELPEGTPIPGSSIFVIRAEDEGTYSTVKLGLNQWLPYKIYQYNPSRIELLVYNVTANIDWVYYERKSDFIQEIKWDQPKKGVLKLTILLNQKTHWGYSVFYEGNVLNLNINKPAERNDAFLFWSNQLKNRKIVLDPGHNPETGSVGPRGTLEKDINMSITLKLKQILEDSGVKVYLTHSGEGIELRDRKEKVNSFNPEICISIHNNAVPEGVNPLKFNGSSVYYYYSQALPLAKLIHRNFVEDLGLNDLGLYWDNLYMCRIHESISLLVEPAFMIVPDQEKKLKTEEFQSKIAKAVFNALQTFYEEYSQ